MINANLTAAFDLAQAKRLSENLGLSFMGVTPAGPFDIPEARAREMLGPAAESKRAAQQ